MNDEVVDEEKLKRTALNAWSPSDRVKAVKQIRDQDFLLNLVLHDLSGKVREAALENITDEDHLVLVAMRSKHEPLRAAAIRRLSTEKSLLRIIDEADFPTSRRAAFEKLHSHQSLATVAIKEGGLLGQLAVEKISESDLLLEIAKETKDISIKWASLNKIKSRYPSIDLETIYFDIASSIEFELEDRLEAAKFVKTSQFLYDLVLIISNELIEEEDSLQSLKKKASLTEFLQQIVGRLPEPLLEKVLQHPSLPISVRILTFPYLTSIEPILEEINNSTPLLVPAFTHLINHRKMYDLGITLFKAMTPDKKLAILQKAMDESFLVKILQNEMDFEILIGTIESFQSPDTLKGALQDFPHDKLSAIRESRKLKDWINEVIDDQLKSKLSLEFESAEDAFTYLKSQKNTNVPEDILGFLVGSPYLIKVLDLPVPISLKKKVIELVPDPLDLQILLLTLPDDELKNAIRSRLGD